MRSRVAEAFRRADRETLATLSPAARVGLALALGERGLALFRAAHVPPLDRTEADRRLERQRQQGRRPSGACAALSA